MKIQRKYKLLHGKRRSGKKQLMYLPTERCLFVQNNERRGNREFQCYQRILSSNDKSQTKCYARAQINNNNECFRNEVDHSDHTDHRTILKSLRVINRIKDVCAKAGADLPTHKVSTKQIFYVETAGYSMILFYHSLLLLWIIDFLSFGGFSYDSDIGLDYDKMKRKLFRIKNAKYPKIPKNVSEIVNAMDDPMIRRNFGYTFNGDSEFYAGTVITAAYYFVVFISQKVINIIEQFIPPSDRNYLIDGTFTVAPRHFYQLLVISVVFRDDVCCLLSRIFCQLHLCYRLKKKLWTFQVFPVFYVLMSRKSAASYKAVFEYIENLFELKPNIIMTDFEKGLRKSVKIVYPNVHLKGCWFHYCSAVRGKYCEFGMRSIVFYNSEAKFFKNKLMNLPLLPPNEIVQAFNLIKRNIQESQLAETFKNLLVYFENYWLVEVSHQNHRCFLYSHFFFCRIQKTLFLSRDWTCVQHLAWNLSIPKWIVLSPNMAIFGDL